MASRRALAERRKAAGYSQQRLAQLLEIHRSTVVRWEAGVTDPVARLRPSLARALTVSIDELDRLLATVTEDHSRPSGRILGARPPRSLPHQGGLSARGGDACLSYLGDIRTTVGVLEELARNDVQRRDFLRRAAFVAAASVAPSRDWLLAALDTTTQARRRPQIGNQDVVAIRQAFAMFQKADVHHGGGHARQALAEYVTQHVLPMLNDVDPDTDAGSLLFAAASEQTYLLGWTSFDDGRHALSQRYLLQALDLARASGDIPLGSYVLAGISAQTRMLGHPREALQLAAAGRHGLRGGETPACTARLWEREAHAHASLGQHKDAARAVVRSQAAFEKARPEEEPEWARFIDRAYLSGEWANTFIDMNRPNEAIEFADQSLADATEQRRSRRAALSHAVLARATLCQPQADVERALHNAHETLTLTTQVRSSRCVAAVQDLQHRLHPYKAVPAVRDFNERARILLPAGA